MTESRHLPRRGRPREIALVSWLALVIAMAIVNVILATGIRGRDPTIEAMWGVAIVAFGVGGAILLHRRPGHGVGRVLMIPTLVILQPLAERIIPASPPDRVGLPLWLALWIGSISWTLLFFPIFHLLMVFPSGEPVSPRWRPLIWLGVGMFTLFSGAVAFSYRIGPFDEVGGVSWSVENPIGLFPSEALFEGVWFDSLWSAGLILLALGGVAALVTRYVRAGDLVRRQIRLVMFAVILFGAIYSALAAIEPLQGPSFDFFLIPAVIFVPVSIVVSILRYRLYEIDRVISRTISYAVVVALLALVFFGVVTLGTSLLPSEDPLLVAVATLASAALFNPLRRRVRRFVDRRFDRARYDSESVLTDFSRMLSNPVDLRGVVDNWLEVVEGTLAPSTAAVWVRPGDS